MATLSTPTSAATPPPPTLPTPEEFRTLIFAARPEVFRFGGHQTRVEREITMEKVSPDLQNAAKFVIVKYILSHLDHVEEEEKKAPRDLIYYMATDDEFLSEEDFEFRCASADWQLAYFAQGDMCFCDFNGWPGDNECGAGVFWRHRFPDVKTVIYENFDGSLTASAYEDIVADIERFRLGPNVDDQAELSSDQEEEPL